MSSSFDDLIARAVEAQQGQPPSASGPVEAAEAGGAEAVMMEDDAEVERRRANALHRLPFHPIIEAGLGAFDRLNIAAIALGVGFLIVMAGVVWNMLSGLSDEASKIELRPRPREIRPSPTAAAPVDAPTMTSPTPLRPISEGPAVAPSPSRPPLAPASPRPGTAEM